MLLWTFRSSFVDSTIRVVVKDNKIVASSGNRYLLYGANLVINRMEREDEGEYICRIKATGDAGLGDGKYILRIFQALTQTVCYAGFRVINTLSYIEQFICLASTKPFLRLGLCSNGTRMVNC